MLDTPMRIIFMGTPEFAVPSLRILLENGINISSVVTVPDKRMGRGLQISYSKVKDFALTNNLNILQPESLTDPEFINQITSQNPDLIIIVAFRILPTDIINIPKYGTINLHASLLPKYRGAAPISRAIINGDNETGLTTFFIKQKVDTGNVILQKRIQILEDEDFGSLYSRLSEEGAQLLLETVNIISSGKYKLIEQDESLASPAPKIFKEDCKINWNKESIIIHNLVRGLSPIPGAFCLYENKTLKLFKSKLSNIKSDSVPGKLIVQGKSIFVNTTDNFIEILELQLEGKKRVKSFEFINAIPKNKEIFLK